MNMINSLVCWSVTLLMFIQTLDYSSHCKKCEPDGRIGDFGNFLNGLAERLQPPPPTTSPRVLRSFKY